MINITNAMRMMGIDIPTHEPLVVLGPIGWHPLNIPLLVETEKAPLSKRQRRRLQGKQKA